MIDVISLPQFEEFISNQKPSTLVIVDFSAKWYSPCPTISRTVDVLTTELNQRARELGAPDRVKHLNLDIDSHEELVEHLTVVMLPTLLAFKDNEMLKELRTVYSRKELRKWMLSMLSLPA